MCSAADLARLDSLLRRGKRLGYCADDKPTVADLFATADDDFFHRAKTNSHHVLQPYLPHQADIPYQLRNRSHNMTLTNKTKFLNNADYIIRIIYKYSYLPFDCITLYCHISCLIVCLSCCMVACDNLN